MTAGIRQPAIKERINTLARQVDRAIDDYCARVRGPETLRRAIQYSLTAGGKRLRPVTTLLTCEACGGTIDDAMTPAVAVEMVHTFSLIHDDLPAMDDDTMRRGKPTSHTVFGEAVAILTGDAMLIAAFELLANDNRNPRIAANMITELAQASGSAGMTGGQVLDMQHDAHNTDPVAVEQIHLMKTAAMIRCAARLGGLAAHADQESLECLSQYGENIGQAFQIVDDLLDVVGQSDTVGKQTGKDAETGKPNYAVLVGIKHARSRAEQLVARAINAIERFGPASVSLKGLAEFVLERQN